MSYKSLLLLAGGLAGLPLLARAQDDPEQWGWNQRRFRTGDVQASMPPGWTADRIGDALRFTRPTAPGAAVEYVIVHPPRKVTGEPVAWLLKNLETRNEDRLVEPKLYHEEGETMYISHDTREPIGGGRETYREYRVPVFGDEAVMVVSHSIAGHPVGPISRAARWIAQSVTLRGIASDPRTAAALTAAGFESSPPPPEMAGPPLKRRTASRPAPTRPTPQREPATKRIIPAKQGASAPARTAAPTSKAAKPNFVGTYFSWGIVNTKLLILPNGTWETAQSKGKWTHGGGRVILFDGNARGWCGGRGILNEEETQLSFDCVSKDGFPMNVSFAKNSKEIIR